jgi:hypothetical protein
MVGRTKNCRLFQETSPHFIQNLQIWVARRYTAEDSGPLGCFFLWTGTYLRNCVKKNLLDAQFILIYFVNLCIFRAYLCPSSGDTTLRIQPLVLNILFRWLSVVLVGLEQSIQDRINLASSWFFFTRLYRDARSTQHTIYGMFEDTTIFRNVGKNLPVATA